MQNALFILEELNDDDVDWMIATGNIQELPADTVIIQQGQPVDALYMVLKGTVIVTVSAPDAPDTEIARLFAGEVVGEMSFVDSRPPSATVTAIADSIVLSIPRHQLATKLQVDIGFSSRFYRALTVLLSSRLRGTVTQLGFGKPQPTFSEDSSLDPHNPDNLMLGKARFDWLLRRVPGN